MRKNALPLLLLILGGLSIALIWYQLGNSSVWREIEFTAPGTSQIIPIKKNIEAKEKEEKSNISFLPLYEDKEEEFISSQADFMEIHLNEMKVRIYEKGKVVKEADVLTKGDSQNWGGTAAGLYDVIRGYSSAYSLVSEVFMPWSLHFYGKYYLHGQPYYPGGEPLISVHSGGCLRLSDKDAKDIYYHVH